MKTISTGRNFKEMLKAGYSAREYEHFVRFRELISKPGKTINGEKLLAALFREPSLFDKLPETLNANVEGSVALLGISKRNFVIAALKYPPLFDAKPETVNTNMEDSAALLGISKQLCISGALREPGRFKQSIEAIHGNVEATAKLIGVEKDRYIAAARQYTPLFYREPKAVNRNIEESAALLESSKVEFVTAALNQPQLLAENSAAVNQRVERSAALLDLSKTAFTAAAMEQPPLFCLAPETLQKKKLYLLSVIQAIGKGQNFETVLQGYPTALMYNENNLHARYVIAKLGLKRGAVGSLLLFSLPKTKKLITGHFKAMMDETGKGRRTLQVLHAQGVIDALPPGVAPIERPPSRRGVAQASATL